MYVCGQGGGLAYSLLFFKCALSHCAALMKTGSASSGNLLSDFKILSEEGNGRRRKHPAVALWVASQLHTWEQGCG